MAGPSSSNFGKRDPVNLGAALRVGAAFGAARVVLLEEAANPFLPKCIRAAGPAVLRLPLLSGPPIRRLPPLPAPLIVLTPQGDPLPSFNFPERCVVLVGLEGQGVPEKLKADFRVRIPTTERVQSLNAVTALTAALYAYRLRHPLA